MGGRGRILIWVRVSILLETEDRVLHYLVKRAVLTATHVLERLLALLSRILFAWRLGIIISILPGSSICIRIFMVNTEESV